MNRNVTVVVILLVLAVIAAYLVWLRGQYQEQITMQPEPAPMVQASPSPVVSALPTISATPSAKEATSSANPKTASPSGMKK